MYECLILVGIFWTNFEHFSNIQVLTFLECSYLMSYECSILIGMSCTNHSHLSIHTIFFMNYEGIIFQCSVEHIWNVQWMLPCPLGRCQTVCKLYMQWVNLQTMPAWSDIDIVPSFCWVPPVPLQVLLKVILKLITNCQTVSTLKLCYC